MEEFANIEYNGKKWKCPIVIGSENEIGIDITKLRAQSGLITLDSGYGNTGSTRSNITYIDGKKGVLRHHGYSIEDLAHKTRFTETAHLLIYGELPNLEELLTLQTRLTENSMIHEDLLHFFDHLPPTGHPMSILSSVVNALSLYYPELSSPADDEETFDLIAASLMSRVRTIAAFSYKKSIGEPFVYPAHDKLYSANFLNMMFDSPVKPYESDPLMEEALNALLIVHADHEQNCSTSTVRMVGSSLANLYSSICAGICALSGPLHGGANQKAIETLIEIKESGLSMKEVIAKARDKNDPFRLSGFGHRVYRNYDPRAKVLKELVTKITKARNIDDPLLDIALELEQLALNDEYFIERKLYPNVDFYSGILYRIMGIPINMFTVMFAIGRMPGWIANWKEMHNDPDFKICRPRQIYTGPTKRDFIPLKDR